VKKEMSLLLIAMSCALMFSTGCSKREQALAGVSVLSAAGAGTSFLRDHFKRNSARRREVSDVRAAAQ